MDNQVEYELEECSIKIDSVVIDIDDGPLVQPESSVTDEVRNANDSLTNTTRHASHPSLVGTTVSNPEFSHSIPNPGFSHPISSPPVSHAFVNPGFIHSPLLGTSILKTDEHSIRWQMSVNFVEKATYV